MDQLVKTWKDSRKDTQDWAYESEVGQNTMKALVSLAYELHLRKIPEETYLKIFKEWTNTVKELLD